MNGRKKCSFPLNSKHIGTLYIHIRTNIQNMQFWNSICPIAAQSNNFCLCFICIVFENEQKPQKDSNLAWHLIVSIATHSD